MELILLASLSMVIQDLFEVLKVDSQSRNRAFLAGLFDTLMYLGLVVSMSVSVTILQGHDLKRKILILVCVSAANFVGQMTGVEIGKRFIKEDKYER